MLGSNKLRSIQLKMKLACCMLNVMINARTSYIQCVSYNILQHLLTLLDYCFWVCKNPIYFHSLLDCSSCLTFPINFLHVCTYYISYRHLALLYV